MLPGAARLHVMVFNRAPLSTLQAFEYTILSLRRKYLNLKSLYYGRYSHLTEENCQPWTPDGCKPSSATS